MKYEFVNFDEDLPVKIILHPMDDRRFIPRHWHESVEVSYILSGSIETIYIEGSSFTSEKGDITVINSNEVHSFSVDPKEENTALTVIISYEFLKENFPEIDRISFQCITKKVGASKQLELQMLKGILDKITAIFRSYDSDSLAHIKIKSLSYDLIYLLLKSFAIEKKLTGAIKSKKHLDLLTEMTNFIKENYNQQLSIDLISNHFGFTSEYLCRFFRKHVGITILQYIQGVRLEKGHRDLVSTDHPITEIAYDNGFPNVKSFNRIFKSIYKSTPNQYRKLREHNMDRNVSN